MNKHIGLKSIINYPLYDQLKKMIPDITQRPRYLKAPYFRNQLLIIKESMKSYGKTITQQQLASLFNTTKDTVNHQLDKAKKDDDGIIKSNGLSFTLNEKEIEELREFVQTSSPSPTVDKVKSFIEENFEKIINHYRIMKLALKN